MKYEYLKIKITLALKSGINKWHDSETKTNPFSLTERLKAARASPGLPSLLLSISLA